MARTPNFYYRDPTQEIAGGIATAIFGDPEKRMQQQRVESEMAERAARTRHATAQAAGQEGQNTAATSLPEMLAAMYGGGQAPARPPAVQSVDDPRFATFETPLPEAPPPVDPLEMFRGGLPQLLGAMGQMRGDKIDPTEMVRGLAAFAGQGAVGDEIARRGMVGAGQTPAASFALTPQRADEIAATDMAGKQKQAWGVAEINNRDDIPVANIQAGARRYSADASAGASRYGADTRAGSSRYATDAKASGTAPGFDAIQRAFPNIKAPTSAWRSKEHNARVGGVSNSMHLGRPGIQAYDVTPDLSMSIEERAARIEEANPGTVKVIEAKRHRAKRPDGSMGGLHDHFALQSTGGKAGKAPAATKPINAETQRSINGAVNVVMAANDLGENEAPKARAYLREHATKLYRQTGDAPSAARKAWDKMQADAKTTRDRRAAGASGGKAGAPRQEEAPVAGARKAPDGFWYVQTGTTPDEKPAYSKVGAKARVATQVLPGERISPAEAQRLPKGTKFVGHDGVERIRR